MRNHLLHIRNFNDDFLLIRAIHEQTSLTDIGQQIYARQFDFIAELIVTEKEICVKLNAGFTTAKLALLHQIKPAEQAKNKSYQLPVYFSENEDWSTIISATGYARDKVIEKLCRTDFSLAMFGFLPGFLYLDGLPPELQVARKKVPSKYIKANALAIGGRYLGLYAIDSPGGWQVIGHTPLQVLQKNALPPVPLNLGDTIRCVSISQTEFDQLLRQSITIIDYNA
ncbi:MAG: carboxyltransferase domain-containing protein [Bacteroidota bacterium]